ncbi:uncharacterized protein LOC132471243 [Gadus macrocephalus]|uniref:uncharacterized protein LOC132471243 n=1 Tax=Gadus macrocephalus TaxID=80720 RepID=UPI0028CB6E8A|nr:uncharacterized protein LOC132471243 [Gadus macrocephalus]XP_059926359.1 uncharacterized protein LOC132471243 [Gadus macrocephalus]
MTNTLKEKLIWPPPKRLAEAVKNESRKNIEPPGTLDVYTLPLKAQPMKLVGCKCFIFGKDLFKQNRTIMVLGETGVGKSTLANRMINYILGVTWDDTFRFKLVDEGTAKSQTHSQTSEVTVYKLNHQEGFQIDYSLTIVDTPGFGDTGGIENDRMIIDQLQRLFSAQNGVSEIDAICLVVQAHQVRLTPKQKYIFDSLLSIFGKDVAENFQILVTFAGEKKPKVLEAIKESGIPCPKSKGGLPICFKFNNEQNDDDDDDDDNDDEDDDAADDKEGGGGFSGQKCWDMGTKNMKKLFSNLNAMNTKSLTLTKEVLRQRAQLEISIENLQRNMKLSLTKVEEIKKEREILQTQEAIPANEAFEYEVSITKPVKVKAKELSLNCNKCNVTCHKSCKVQFDTMYYCEAFTLVATCVECIGKCSLKAHVRESFYWDSETVKEKRTFKMLKEKYEMALKKKMSDADIIKNKENEYIVLHEEVVRLIERSAQCLNTLREIALKPDPLSTTEYIDLLIEGEKSEAKPGFQERVKELGELKKNYAIKRKVAGGAGQPVVS